MNIKVEKENITVYSKEFKAVFKQANLVSITPLNEKIEFMHPDKVVIPLDLYFIGNYTLRKDKHQQYIFQALSNIAARIIIKGEESDLSLLITLNETTGEMCVTPSGLSSRRGLISMRWNIAFNPLIKLILPCVGGITIDNEKPFSGNDRFAWPSAWNAQLVIAERNGYSCMINSYDTSFKFKALNLERQNNCNLLGFESETVGPLWNNRTAGGIEWRINVVKGDWKKAAQKYRKWMHKAYGLEKKEKERPKWVEDIDLAICWAKPDTEILDILAKFHAPKNTLIHLSDWRTDKYDINYPQYIPSASTIRYMQKANKMGFKVMPHFNYFSVYYKHPFYQEVHDFQIRDAYNNEPQGWKWPPATHNYTQMAYIHPGLSLWRRKIIESIANSCKKIQAPAAFIDQTLNTWNTDNGLVEGMNTIEGLYRLQEELASIYKSIVLAGEGLNEVSFQRECFAQAHIYKGLEALDYTQDLESSQIETAHPVCSFLWENHTKLIGFHHLSPQEKDFEIGVEIYKRMRVMPTLIPRNKEDIEKGLKVIFQ